METLIVKLGATGDVVRTTPLLKRLGGRVTWLTAAKNKVLLESRPGDLRCFSWEERSDALDRAYDLVINLEDTLEVAQFLKKLSFNQLFGAYAGPQETLLYTEDSRQWFDLSLISRFGREKADGLKFRNRSSYQDLIFKGLGLVFSGETYLLPTPDVKTPLYGDVAIAAEAGPVWPMKNWAYYAELKEQLEARGLLVNFLPKRESLLQHLSDVRNHRCLVGGDSLPMHLALGTNTPCVTLFTCTSPWEIYDYGIQKKIVSPLLEQFFYKREYDRKATTVIDVADVMRATMESLERGTLTREKARRSE
jgi:heptosyltransferase-2